MILPRIRREIRLRIMREDVINNIRKSVVDKDFSVGSQSAEFYGKIGLSDFSLRRTKSSLGTVNQCGYWIKGRIFETEAETIVKLEFIPQFGFSVFFFVLFGFSIVVTISEWLSGSSVWLLLTPLGLAFFLLYPFLYGNISSSIRLLSKIIGVEQAVPPKSDRAGG